MRAQRITTDHALYPGACALRDRVLLEPIGYSLERLAVEYPGFEERFEHFVATDPEDDTRVIGVVCLYPKPDAQPPEGKLMQMAVDEAWQGQGVGRVLVAELMDRATSALGLRRVYCHARIDACKFYERLGWQYESGIFMEAEIEHRVMAVGAE
ncbi:MAG: GNAT family N-acetyltransferase [Planctomycetota bacterium]